MSSSTYPLKPCLNSSTPRPSLFGSSNTPSMPVEVVTGHATFHTQMQHGIMLNKRGSVERLVLLHATREQIHRFTRMFHEQEAAAGSTSPSLAYSAASAKRFSAAARLRDLFPLTGVPFWWSDAHRIWPAAYRPSSARHRAWIHVGNVFADVNLRHHEVGFTCHRLA